MDTKVGNKMPARTAITATTTSNSISVNPDHFIAIAPSLFNLARQLHFQYGMAAVAEQLWTGSNL
jgi:hypothetical protein